MARGINKVILIGNVGREPETRYGTSGGAICNFSVATTESCKDRETGEKKEQTEWHRIVTFRRLAEICAEYLRRGSKVYIEGKLQTRKWEDDGGNTKWTTEIVANEMQMLDTSGTYRVADKGIATPTEKPKTQPAPPPEGQPQGAHNAEDPFQDNIPF